MEKIKIISVVGARPNFMKIAPLLRELSRHKEISSILVHTGQHYAPDLSEVFFRELAVPRHINLNIGPGSSAAQIKRIMQRLEKVLAREKPDLAVVVGDVNSTLAAALVAAKLKIKLAHIEAGLRSFDRSMPEEINRLLTDSLSDYLFVSEPRGSINLRKEGLGKDKIFYVGNIMLDSLVYCLPQARNRKFAGKLKLKEKDYAVFTLHRPANVDAKGQLKSIVYMLAKLQKNIKIVYPVHPRARKMFERFALWKTLGKLPNLVLLKPLGYLDFLSLMLGAKFIVTDSGGMQAETTFLNIPCFTLRQDTEQPVTVEQGTNILVGNDYALLLRLIKRIPERKKINRPKFWDGKTAGRIVKILRGKLIQKA